MSSGAVVELRDVTKEYPRGLFGKAALRAVDRVSLAVRPGEVFGLLGPNRAGKTTLVKLILSLCRPTSGTIERFGRPGAERRTLAQVGYVHENQAFPRHLSATALLHYYGSLGLISDETLRGRVPRLLEQVGLADRAAEPISRYSKGMIQRLGVAQALLNEPELLVLDEPSEGLDLAGRQMLRAAIAAQRERGRAVLYVSHVLQEIETLCDRVGVIVAGRLKFLDSLATLTRDPRTGAARSLEAALRELYRPD